MARVCQAMDEACEITDLALPVWLPGEADGLAFSVGVEGTLASLPRREIEEKTGGVTGARVLCDASKPTALYRLSYLRIPPKAGIEPATSAWETKEPHPHCLKKCLRRKSTREVNHAD